MQRLPRNTRDFKQVMVSPSKKRKLEAKTQVKAAATVIRSTAVTGLYILRTVHVHTIMHSIYLVVQYDIQ